MEIRGVKTQVLNLSSFDFLGMSQNPAVKDASKSALEVYGCGSCGPRGFYGTIDQHLIIEAAVAEFMGTQVTITRSQLKNLKILSSDHNDFRRQSSTLTAHPPYLRQSPHLQKKEIYYWLMRHVTNQSRQALTYRVALYSTSSTMIWLTLKPYCSRLQMTTLG